MQNGVPYISCTAGTVESRLINLELKMFNMEHRVYNLEHRLEIVRNYIENSQLPNKVKDVVSAVTDLDMRMDDIEEIVIEMYDNSNLGIQSRCSSSHSEQGFIMQHHTTK